MAKYLLGLDCGHTVTKAVLFDLAGKQIAVGKGSNDQISLHSGWQERTMEAAAQAALTAIKEAIVGIDANEIAAIGVAGHGDGLYLVDKDLKPIRNAIFATDNRASELVQKINQENHDFLMQEMNQVLFAASPASLLVWLKEQEPENYKKIGYILQCKDWIRTVLTGNPGTDLSDAASIGVSAGLDSFSLPIIEKLGLSDVFSALPKIALSGAVVGEITEEISKQTGLAPKTQVIAGSHDVHATAIGTGAYAFGDVSLIFGTWSINQTFAKEKHPDFRWQVRNSVEANHFLHMCTSPASASNANWFWNLFGISDEQDLANTLEEAEKSFLKTDRAFYLPYLFGGPAYQTPGASLIGARGWHTKADVVATVLEGIVFNHKHHMDMLSEKVSTSGRIIASGGSMRSQVWGQLVADIFDREIEISDADEAGARGIAMLAGVSQKIYTSIDDAISKCVSNSKIYRPNPDKTEFFKNRYVKYRELARSATHV
jgi:L-xylulokinase